MIEIFKLRIFMDKKPMNKPAETTQKPAKSRKKLILIGVVFVACALFLKRDAH